MKVAVRWLRIFNIHKEGLVVNVEHMTLSCIKPIVFISASVRCNVLSLIGCQQAVIYID